MKKLKKFSIYMVLSLAVVLLLNAPTEADPVEDPAADPPADLCTYDKTKTFSAVAFDEDKTKAIEKCEKKLLDKSVDYAGVCDVICTKTYDCVTDYTMPPRKCTAKKTKIRSAVILETGVHDDIFTEVYVARGKIKPRCKCVDEMVIE